MSGRTQLVIFDMDGTLVNTEPLYKKHIVALVAEWGARITGEEFDRYVGMEARMMWNTIKETHQLSLSVESMRFTYRSRIFDYLENNPIPVVQGVESLLEVLESKRIACCIGSSATHRSINLLLGKTGLRRFFNRQFSGEEVAQGKPAPDIFLKAAWYYRMAPQACLVIEDSRNGVLAAKAAGMRCVAFQNPDSGCQDLQPADLIVESFDSANRQKIMRLMEE